MCMWHLCACVGKEDTIVNWVQEVASQGKRMGEGINCGHVI
jgi:hypothetical protein